MAGFVTPSKYVSIVLTNSPRYANDICQSLGHTHGVITHYRVRNQCLLGGLPEWQILEYRGGHY